MGMKPAQIENMVFIGLVTGRPFSLGPMFQDQDRLSHGPNSIVRGTMAPSLSPTRLGISIINFLLITNYMLGITLILLKILGIWTIV